MRIWSCGRSLPANGVRSSLRISPEWQETPTLRAHCAGRSRTRPWKCLLRAYLDGSDRQASLWRRPARMRRIERLPVPGEVFEDPLDDLRLLYARNRPQRATAATAGVDGDLTCSRLMAARRATVRPPPPPAPVQAPRGGFSQDPQSKINDWSCRTKLGRFEQRSCVWVFPRSDRRPSRRSRCRA